MKTLETQLAHYASYHRDRRNIFTHFFGIPLIVLAVMGLTWVPVVTFGPWTVTVAFILTVPVCLYYLKLSLGLGVMMTVILTLFYLVVQYLFVILSQDNIVVFYGMWIGVFVFGWILQFIGHYYEGKKPAFVDDMIGFLIGPLFVLVELLFLMGLYRQLEQDIIATSGPYK